MKRLVSLVAVWFCFFACKPDMAEIEQNELKYNRIADSVLNSNMPPDDTSIPDTLVNTATKSTK